MFENFKAFIRHGKQANARKHGQYHDYHQDILPAYMSPATMLESSAGAETVTPSPITSSAGSDPSVPLQDTANSSIEPHPVISINVSESLIPESTTKGQGDSTLHLEDHQYQTATLNAHHGNHHRHDYETLAHQIVEEERMMRERRQSQKYPNLDAYEVLEKMGEGAFSIVYKARHISSNTFVAIKILRKFQMDQAQKQSVLKEVTIMRQLNHPNIVRFIEFIDLDKYYYIVQELAVGGEVFTAIVNFTYFSEDVARHVITQVAHAIRYLHDEVGVVHRDIKPENLLFYPVPFHASPNPYAKLRRSDDPNSKKDEGIFTPGVGGATIGVVKLADFGLSKQIWEHNTKTPCGTVGYTAPEIVRDQRYSREVDMWALGCVLYTFLCGFPPFYDERIEMLTEKVAKGEYTFLKPWWDEISPEAKYCVSRLLTVDPNHRYTIDEFLNDPWMQKCTLVPTQHYKQPSAHPQQHHTKSSHAHGHASASHHTHSQSLSDSHRYSHRHHKNQVQDLDLAPDEPIPVGIEVQEPETTTLHPVQSQNSKYKNYMESGMYSPAAVALRDMFDISAAVHRMGEEKKLARNNRVNDIVEEADEDMEEEVDSMGEVEFQHPRRRELPAAPKNDLFDLTLKGASILERRRNNKIKIPPVSIAVPGS